MNGEKAFFGFLGVVVLAIAVSVLIGCQLEYLHDEKMAKMGYEETSIVGQGFPVWCKIREAD